MTNQQVCKACSDATVISCTACAGAGLSAGLFGFFRSKCPLCAGTGKVACEVCRSPASPRMPTKSGGHVDSTASEATDLGAAAALLGCPPEVVQFLAEVAGDEDGMLIHGMGDDIDLIPPGLRRAQILSQHFDTTNQFRMFLSRVIRESADPSLVHGAIKLFKKVGGGECANLVFTPEFVEALLCVLHRPPLDGALYADALMLVSYCNPVVPLSSEDRARLLRRGASPEVAPLTKFTGLLAMMSRGWGA